MSRLLLLVAAMSAGCLRQTQFQCKSDSACGTDGRCESTGFCSFPDGACETGRRYNDTAGSLNGQCTGGTTSGDGGGDAPVSGDGTGSDTASAGCPSGYVALPGLTTTHLYKLLTITNDWSQQQAACRLTTQAANLAIPDDATELTALDTFAGGIPTYWIGVDDMATEGTFVTVLNTAQTFLPWDVGQPDNSGGAGGSDCVEVLTATAKFDDVRCNSNLAAICECIP